jgi:glycosyl hydrolase family 20
MEVNMSALEFRGFMLDACRLRMSMDYYKKFINFASECNVTHIILRLADDQGNLFPFKKHKELNKSKYIFKRKELEELKALAQSKGIIIVPEIECLGHAEYIIGLEQYKEMACVPWKKSDEYASDVSVFNSLCPSHPEVLPLVTDLILEVADFFDSEHVLLGFDETTYGLCKRCKEKTKGMGRGHLFVEYLRSLKEKMSKKRIMIWGDHVLADDYLLENLDKDIIICDWKYSPCTNGRTFSILKEHGFHVIACPSAHCAHDRVTPNLKVKANIRLLMEKAKEKNFYGAIITQWCPWRYLADAMWPILHYAATLMNDEKDAKNFGQLYWGIEGNKYETIINAFYTMMPEFKLFNCIFPVDDESFLERIRSTGHEIGIKYATSLEALEGFKTLELKHAKDRASLQVITEISQKMSEIYAAHLDLEDIFREEINYKDRFDEIKNPEKLLMQIKEKKHVDEIRELHERIRDFGKFCEKEVDKTRLIAWKTETDLNNSEHSDIVARLKMSASCMAQYI